MVSDDSPDVFLEKINSLFTVMKTEKEFLLSKNSALKYKKDSWLSLIQQLGNCALQ